MRRMWMLLLVVAMMVIALAIPAMALAVDDSELDEDGGYYSCECAKAGRDADGEPICIENCPGGTEVYWVPFTGSAVPNTTGNYYLTANVSCSAKTISAAATIRLDLNGYQMKNSSSYQRMWALHNTSNYLSITDSAPERDNDGDDVADGGSIKCDANYAQGGIVWMRSAATLKLYAGTLDGTEYTTVGTNPGGGTIVHMSGKSYFYMYGGRILGCTVTEGALETKTSTSGGVTYKAFYPLFGPVYASTSGKFEMHGGEIVGGFIQGNPVWTDGTYSQFYDINGKTAKADTSKAKMISNSGITAKGAAIYIAGPAELHGGTITGGTVLAGETYTAKYVDNYTEENAAKTYEVESLTVSYSGHAGTIWINSNTTTIHDGVTISGGVAPKNGGSVYVNDSATLIMEGGSISDGCSSDQGGNMFVTGSVQLTGGTISGGKAKNGGNIGINSSKTVTLGGAAIEKGEASENGGNVGINSTKTCTVTIDGISITGGTAKWGGNLYVNTNTANGDKPNVTVTLTSGTISGGTGRCGSPNVHINCNADCTVTVDHSESVDLSPYVTLGNNVDGITLNTAMTKADFTEGGYTVYHYDLADSWAAAGQGSSYVALQADMTGTMAVAHNMNLDLNGHTVALNLADGVNIQLLDSSAAGYEVGSGSASITGGTVVSDFLTGSLTNYGHNYRFITVQDAEGKYTSHRIYLAVKATILYPGVAPYIGYRTALRCDDTIAALINADGGEYGLLLNSVYTDYNKTAGAYVTDSTDNSTRVKLDNLLGDDETKYEERSTATVFANAYIKIGDSTYTSANSTAHSLKSLTEAIVALDQSTIGESAKTALGQMYDTYSSFMAAWTGVADVLDDYYTAE